MKKKISGCAAARPQKHGKQGDRRHNPDWIERQKPCDICGVPIGDEAMVTGVQSHAHARCLRKQWDEMSAVEKDDYIGIIPK